MKPIIAVMNARKMPDVIAALDSIKVDIAWMKGFWEVELNNVMRSVVERAEWEDYTHLALLSDDIVLQADSMHKVFDLIERGHPAVTAYCDMFRGSPDVNITKKPFDNTTEPLTRYYLYTRDEADNYESDVIPTWFMGWGFSMMSIEMWKRFPFIALSDNPSRDKGWASDWHSSVRLHKASIPMVAPRGAFVQHLKAAPGAPLTMARPTRYDIAMWRRKVKPLVGSELLIGSIPKEVVWEYK